MARATGLVPELDSPFLLRARCLLETYDAEAALRWLEAEPSLDFAIPARERKLIAAFRDRMPALRRELP